MTDKLDDDTLFVWRADHEGVQVQIGGNYSVRNERGTVFDPVSPIMLFHNPVPDILFNRNSDGLWEIDTDEALQVIHPLRLEKFAVVLGSYLVNRLTDDQKSKQLISEK